MPSGGVSPDRENLTAWFKAGVTCVGLGSQLTPKEVIEKGDWAFIENKVREALAIVKELKM
jgi:2-dehydro-3-deoxyphosphogluconate aldolase/(4S)-4-hydroxy-2-oxoglutarate aldolase